MVQLVTGEWWISMTFRWKKQRYPSMLVMILAVLVITVPVVACETLPPTCPLPPPSYISSIFLTPESASKYLPDETSQTFTAAVLDQFNHPLSGVLVMFTTDFGYFQGDSRLTGLRTDSNGQASVTVISSNVGTATIRAWIDTDTDHEWEPGELSDTSTMTWLPPESPPSFTCPAGSYSLVTAEGETTGCVAVSNGPQDGKNILTVAYSMATCNCLERADLATGLTPAEIPQVNGVPALEMFPYTQVFDSSTCTETHSFSLDITYLGDIAYMYLSAHAQTRYANLEDPDAWVLSDTLVDANGAPAKYFEYIIQ